MSKLIEDLERIVAEDELRLRDHFAGLAMQGFLASYGNYGNYGTWDDISKMSYQIADAMLNQRKEVEGE